MEPGTYRLVPLERVSSRAELYLFPGNANNVKEVLAQARTIFVNAVMGYTPFFAEGSKALDQSIDKNQTAYKMYGGGDTLQEFKDLNPGLYLSVIDNTQYYFFTGGGTVLTAIEEGTPYRLKTIQALMENRAWAS